MLLVDPRVGSQHLAGHFDELHLPYELTPLDYADVAFMGNGPDGPVGVGIELKNTLDFINSMHSGRLAGHQIPGLQERYAHVWIVVEGFYRSRKGSGIAEIPRGPTWVPLYLGKRPVFWNDIELFITSLEVQAGVHVRRTRTPHETARLIGNVIYGWWSKPWEQHTSLKQLDQQRPARISLRREEDPVRRLMHNVAACLPGIGYERGRRISEHFGSLDEMWTATPEQWQQALGVAKGTKHARDIVAAIHERAAAKHLRPRDATPRGSLRPNQPRESQRAGPQAAGRGQRRSARRH